MSVQRTVAQKVEDELGEESSMLASGCKNEWKKLPRSDLLITVGNGSNQGNTLGRVPKPQSIDK